MIKGDKYLSSQIDFKEILRKAKISGPIDLGVELAPIISSLINKRNIVNLSLDALNYISEKISFFKYEVVRRISTISSILLKETFLKTIREGRVEISEEIVEELALCIFSEILKKMYDLQEYGELGELERKIDENISKYVKILKELSRKHSKSIAVALSRFIYLVDVIIDDVKIEIAAYGRPNTW